MLLMSVRHDIIALFTLFISYSEHVNLVSGASDGSMIEWRLNVTSLEVRRRRFLLMRRRLRFVLMISMR